MPPRLPTISFLVHFRVNLRANYPSRPIVYNLPEYLAQMSTAHSSFDQYCISHKNINHQAAAARGPELSLICPFSQQILATPLLRLVVSIAKSTAVMPILTGLQTSRKTDWALELLWTFLKSILNVLNFTTMLGWSWDQLISKYTEIRVQSWDLTAVARTVDPELEKVRLTHKREMKQLESSWKKKKWNWERKNWRRKGAKEMEAEEKEKERELREKELAAEKEKWRRLINWRRKDLILRKASWKLKVN